MKPLFLIIVFFWLQLVENTGLIGQEIFDLGNGVEIRYTLVLKFLLLLCNIYYICIKKNNFNITKFVIWPSLFLFFSTGYLLFFKQEYFLSALTVNIHIQLMLNIILFIFTFGKTKSLLIKLYKFIRFFAIVNALLVIVSYIFPDISPLFEVGVSNGTKRAFGVMGDEVSLFMTFFIYESLINRRYKSLLVYILALLFNGSIGTSVIVFALILYYLIFEIKINIKKIFLYTSFFALIGGALSIGFFNNVGFIKRINENFDGSKKGTGGLRIVSLKVAYDMIKERPILGTGYGAYRKFVFDKYSVKMKKNGYEWIVKSTMVILTSAFNPFVQMLGEAGIVGLILFLIYLRKVFLLFRCKVEKADIFFDNFTKSTSGWFLVFILTSQSANWILPSSFILLLVVSLIGIKLKYLHLLEEKTVF